MELPVLNSNSERPVPPPKVETMDCFICEGKGILLHGLVPVIVVRAVPLSGIDVMIKVLLPVLKRTV